MELDMLIMPNLAKVEFSVEPEHWQDEMLKVKRSFIDKNIYTTRPIIFTKEITGLGEISYTTYIALNDEIEEVFPTLSHKCFDDEDFEQIYEVHAEIDVSEVELE